MRKLIMTAALIAATTLPMTAQAAGLINGSFEMGTDPGSFTQLAAGSTNITGWTIGSGTIDYVGTYWVAGDGTRSIDLSGGGFGSISQTFDTIAGLEYYVTFLLAANPAGPPPGKAVNVSATGNASSTFNFPRKASALNDMSWLEQTYGFTATGSSTTLTFTSLVNTAFGPAIDNVAVSAVPESSTWAMMIMGLGLVGGAMRRRSVKVAFA